MSGSVLIADSRQTSREVRKVPTRDSCTAANSGKFDQLFRALSAAVDLAAQRVEVKRLGQKMYKRIEIQSTTPSLLIYFLVGPRLL
jgi:hypothetical protein